MRVTVCELPHDPLDLATTWGALCAHTKVQSSELVLLPEFAFVEPVWESHRVDAERWASVEWVSRAWMERLPELRVAHVVGTRPASADRWRFNQGYCWSTSRGVVPLRSKFYMPNETGSWEANWFERGDATFPAFRAGSLSFGLNICTELWALETYVSYATRDVQVIMCPRASAASTTAKWLAMGTVAAVRSGAYCLSSNRVDPSGACGGASWIISPQGDVLARTSRDVPFATVDIDLTLPAAARSHYPCYVFDGPMS